MAMTAVTKVSHLRTDPLVKDKIAPQENQRGIPSKILEKFEHVVVEFQVPVQNWPVLFLVYLVKLNENCAENV